MSGLPWVRFFPSDWLAGSRGLSAAETGVYISLIAMMYERGEPLAEDPGRLARLCGASNSQFQKALGSLIAEGKIVRVEGGLWNARVEKEQVYRSEKSEVGKQAAEKRWQKNKQNQCHADAIAMPEQCDGNANQKPEPERSEPKGSSRSAKRGSRIDDFEPDIEAAVGLGLSAEQARFQADCFKDFWRGKAGQAGVKLDWPATWRNWVRDKLPANGRSALRIVGGQQAPPQRLKPVGHRMTDKMLGRTAPPEPNPDEWRTVDAYATRN